MAGLSSDESRSEGVPEGADEGATSSGRAGRSTADEGDPRAAADRRLTEALAARSVADPRPQCREHLRRLKQSDPERYGEAVEYYEAELLPGIAEGTADPVDAWLGFAAKLAAFQAPGRLVAVDRTGASGPAEAADPGRFLLLHLPDQPGGGVGSALQVSEPEEPSPAQRATRSLLVEGRKQWKGPDPEDEPAPEAGTDSQPSTGSEEE